MKKVAVILMLMGILMSVFAPTVLAAGDNYIYSYVFELDLKDNNTAIITADQCTTSRAPISGVKRVYVWSISSGKDIVSITYDNSQTCRVTALKEGTAEVGCSVTLTYEYQIFMYGETQKMPTYEKKFGGHWTITVKDDKITVKLDADGGTVDPASLGVMPGGYYGRMPGAFREGYEFIGWYNGDTEITPLTLVSDNVQPHTLVAKYKKIEDPSATVENISLMDSCAVDTIWKFYDTGKLVISGPGEEWTQVFSDFGDIYSLVLEGGVKTIYEFAFAGCTGLKSVTLGEGLESISQRAFFECPSLTEVTVPESVKEIGLYAFGYVYKDSTSYEVKAIEGFKIYGYEGSAAQEYAESNGFEFIALCKHTYGEGKIEKAATCTEDGTQTKTCSSCKETVTETIAATGHNYSKEWTVDKAATCTEKGSKSYHCANCDSKSSVTEIPATGHKFGEWKTDGVICEKDGEQKRTCSVCNYSESKAVKATGHNYSKEWTVDKAPTCTEKGSKSYHCTNCDSKSSVTEIPAAGHKFEEWITETAATCTKEGIQKRSCSVCKESETQSIAATGHEFGEWTVITEPTYVNPGIETRTCKNCDAAETRETEKLVITKEVKDETSGITVLFGDNTYTEDITVNVSEVSDSGAFEIISENVGNYATKIFDITTSAADQKVQPNGTVLVKMPIPEGFNPEKLAIYFIPNDGSAPEKLNCYVEGEYVCFETTHFSQYAIVDVSEELPEYVLGDVNSDGNVNAADARLALRISADLETPTDIQKKAADVDLNGNVNAADARLILRKSADLDSF